MKWVILAIGLCATAFGTWWGWFGWSIVQVERGWSAVIAGSFLAGCGLLLIGIAAVMARIDAVVRLLRNHRPSDTVVNAPASNDGQASAPAYAPPYAQKPSRPSPAPRPGAPAVPDFVPEPPATVAASPNLPARDETPDAPPPPPPPRLPDTGFAGLRANTGALVAGSGGVLAGAAIAARAAERPAADEFPDTAKSAADPSVAGARDSHSLEFAAEDETPPPSEESEDPETFDPPPPRRAIDGRFEWPASPEHVDHAGSPDEVEEDALPPGFPEQNSGNDATVRPVKAQLPPLPPLPSLPDMPAKSEVPVAATDLSTTDKNQAGETAPESGDDVEAGSGVPEQSGQHESGSAAKRDTDDGWFDELLDDSVKAPQPRAAASSASPPSPVELARALNEMDRGIVAKDNPQPSPVEELASRGESSDQSSGEDRADVQQPDTDEQEIAPGHRETEVEASEPPVSTAENIMEASPEGAQPPDSGLAEDVGEDAAGTVAAPEANVDAPKPELLRSYESQGVRYFLYVDGSIEAHAPQGVLRFSSLEELRGFIEKRRP
ncbi:MAG: hypothetical protein AB7F96_02585 [Beijerinckiaceae bacterium]